MKWDVKHDRAKKVIDRFLDNAGYWQDFWHTRERVM